MVRLCCSGYSMETFQNTKVDVALLPLPFNPQRVKERPNSMKTKKKVIAVIASLAGCMQMQLQAGLQDKLQSSDKQVRIKAVAQVHAEDYFNVLFGRKLNKSRHLFGFGRDDVDYATDVKFAVVDKMFHEGLFSALIAMATDYRMGGGKDAMIEGDTPITQYISDKFRTPEGLEELCNRLGDNPRSLADKDKIFVQRLGLVEGGWEVGKKGADRLFCSLWLSGDDEFFTWLAMHPDLSEVRTALTHKGEVGEEAVRKISGADSLSIIAQNIKCSESVRIQAAKKLFNHANVTGEQILAVITSFNGVDEETLGKIAYEGLKAAKRIGATNVVQALESK